MLNPAQIMNCKDCQYAIIGKEKSDQEMARHGYKTCKLAHTEVERATFVRGIQKCLWPERRKQ